MSDDRKVELERLRDELKERLERYRAHRQHLGGPVDRDMEDQPLETRDDEVVASLEAEAEDELAQVRHALARIREGRGEICERCGEVIDAGRLAAVSHATLCRECRGD
ncbi:TraR/DksA family transcriptional regulator [Halomonas organivorans]|uniref:RNA polymerase-binding transcription factor DksA n=1 Tax=Halomonas organivorans TaxID=257772 RepID=A0A7W5BXX3_9GAMM|nr:TraR/DksA C4-type zinc finger protein [Halomonas organivorans]MBB3141192.1 RNA polymerase-binding transcription factor DksA [Halomonas organivorans]